MSFNVVMEDYWGATTRCTIRERCKFMFNNELLSDVKFVVRARSQGGSDSMKKIPAHKFVLAISSPVFFAMFYGELAETKDSVDISDCEYESLLEFFRFVYSDEVKLDPDNVMQVLYLAKKYMLPSLADKCTEYLREKLDSSNVFHVLPDAQKYEEKDLVVHCWEVIDKQANEAVKSDGFVTIDRSVLEELVERDSWARRECKKQGLKAEGSVKRRVLGERIIKGIRFPLMEEKEFAKVVLDCDILTKKESFDMMKYFNSVLDFPVGFSEAKRAGFPQRICRFNSAKVVKGWQYGQYYRCSDSIGLSVNKNINLHAVRLFGSENNKYSINVNICNYANNTYVATQETGQFHSKIVQSEGGDYHGFDIVFEPPIALQAQTNYCFQATINGPPSWYGQGGLSRVEHSGVTFTFTTKSGTDRTTVTKGQFPEFEFTLN